MPAPNTSYIYKMGTSPNTRTAISQKNKVYGYSLGGGDPGFKQMGAVSEFGWDESRTIDPVRGIGYGDMIAELVPSVTEPMTLTLNKTLLYTANLFQIVGYKGGIDGIARSLRHHRWPFDIKQELVFSEIASLDDGATGLAQAIMPVGGMNTPSAPSAIGALLTFFEGCWMNSFSASITSDAAIIAENSSVTVTDILDGVSNYGEYFDTGLSPTTPNASAGKGYSFRFGQSTYGSGGGGQQQFP